MYLLITYIMKNKLFLLRLCMYRHKLYLFRSMLFVLFGCVCCVHVGSSRRE